MSRVAQHFRPFFGYWRYTEYPPGTPATFSSGCRIAPASQGIFVEMACAPTGEEGEAAQVFWHPVDRRFVFRLYSVRNPVDLLFEGEYRFPEPNVMERSYRGYYGDGRIHLYRETFSLEGDGRMVQRTERFTEGSWQAIFPGSVLERERARDEE